MYTLQYKVNLDKVTNYAKHSTTGVYFQLRAVQTRIARKLVKKRKT